MEERDFEEDVRKYIKYIGEKYPEELKEFANKIQKTFYKDGVLQEEFLQELVSMKELEPYMEKEILEQFRNNVDRFVRLEKEYENSREEICKWLTFSSHFFVVLGYLIWIIILWKNSTIF